MAQSAPSVIFNYPQSSTTASTTTANINAARVNAFYLVNTIHDLSYGMGSPRCAFTSSLGQHSNSLTHAPGYSTFRPTTSEKAVSGLTVSRSPSRTMVVSTKKEEWNRTCGHEGRAEHSNLQG
jgi:hypothetical protein